MLDYYIIFGMILAFVVGGLVIGRWVDKRDEARRKGR